MGASSVGTQLRCSLWRHYLAHLRQWPWVLGALVVALVPFALLAGLKSTAPPEHVDTCHFEARGLSTEQPLGLLQSFVCGISNDCQEEGQDDLLDQYPGAAVNELIHASFLIDGSTSGSILEPFFALPQSLKLLQGMTDLITTPALTTLMENGLQVSEFVKSPSELIQKLTLEHDLDLEVVEAFLNSRINVSRVLSLAGVRGPKEVVCSPEYLAEFLVTNNTHLVSDISRALCHLPLSQSANVTVVFLASLDPGKLLQKVGDVIEAIGGYNAEVLLQQVGGLVGAVGRLEGLASLSSSLTPIFNALDPARNAMKILSLSMWDEVSLGDFMGYVESVMSAFTSNSSSSSMKLKETFANISETVVHILHITENPDNLTSTLQAHEDPWEAVLQEISGSAESVVTDLEFIPDYLRERPVLRSVLSLSAAGLSMLLQSQPYNTTSLNDQINESLSTLLEASHIPLNTSSFLTLLPLIQAADTFTEAADAMSSLVVKEPPLPLLPSFTLLTLLSNCSQLKSVIEDEGLDSWLCGDESKTLQQLSVDDRNTLTERFCSSDSKTELRRITDLLQTALNYSQLNTQEQDGVSPSEVMEAVKNLLKTLESSVYLHQAINLTQNIPEPSVDLEWWRRWEPSEEVLVGEMWGSMSEALFPLLPPLGTEGFQDLEEGVKVSKYVIHKLVTMYLNLMGGECGDVPGRLTSVLPPRGLQNIADIVTSVMDTLVHVVALTQDPWRPGDLLRHPNITTFLTRALPPNVMVVVTRGLEIAQSPWVNVPPPIPQILTLLNATHSALTSVLEENDVWAWCGEGSCPHLANLTSNFHLLPYLVALPYFTNMAKLEKDKREILVNSKSWRYYPCQDYRGNTSPDTYTPASLSLFFPPTSSFTSASQPTIQKVKEGVKDLEDYVCQNFDGIVDELTSNEGLTTAVKAFMDHLTPERINLGSAVGQVRSLWRTMTHLDLHQVITDLTGGSLMTLEEWRRPYRDLALNYTTDPIRLLLDKMERMMETSNDFKMWNGTRVLSDSINLGLHAAHNITTAITHTLQKEDISLAEVLGLSGNDPLFSLFTQGPEGLSDYILHEMTTSFISAVTDNEVVEWANGLCQRTTPAMSPWVEVVCNYTNTGIPPTFLRSNVSKVVIQAMTQFQQSEPPRPPQMPLAQLYSDFELLIETLRTFNFSTRLNTSTLDLTVNIMRREAENLVAGLRAIQEEWPFLLLDALLQREAGQMQALIRAQALVRDMDTALTLLLRGIPSSDDSTTSPVAELYHLLNTTWIDLLVGIHYNIQLHPSIKTLTMDQVCGSNSTLEEPAGGGGGGGSFLEAVQKMCQFVSNNSDIFDDFKFSQNIPPLPSTKDVYHKARELVGRVQEVVAASRGKDLKDILGWPSYFIKDNWRSVLARIYPNEEEEDGMTQDDLDELVPSVVMALRWLGVPQNSTLPNYIKLQTKWMKLLLADDLKEVLNSTVTLNTLADTLTLTSPLAVKDLVNSLTQHPDKVGETLVALMALQEEENWTELCQLDVSDLGSHLTALLNQLCQLKEEELMQDLRSVLGLDLLRQNPENTTSLKASLEAFMTQLTTLGDMERIGTPLAVPGALVQYLGLEGWTNLTQDAFNVTKEEMEANSTMILAALLGPLVARGGEETQEGHAIKAALTVITKYLRLAQWLMVLDESNLKEAYMDKPMVIQLLDYLDQAPEIAKEYIKLFSQYSVLSKAMTMKAEPSCPFHLSLLEKLAEEVEVEGKEGMQLLNTTIHFLCLNSIRLYLLDQLIPTTAPVIMGEPVGVDAATLAFLLNSVGRGVVEVVGVRHIREVFHTPPWLAEDRWDQVYQELRHLIHRPMMEVVLDVASLGLSAAQTHSGDSWVNTTLPQVASMVYQLSSRLGDAINVTTGRLDLPAAAQGLGSVEELVALVSPNLSTYVALAMWYPESYANWRLVRGDHWLLMLDEMCEKGPQHLLLNPELSPQDWEGIRPMFCNFSLPQLRQDLGPLFNVTQVMKGELVDVSKVRDAVDRLLTRLPHLNTHKLEEPFVNNSFTRTESRLNPVRRIIQGVLGQSIWMSRAMTDNLSRWSQYRVASSLTWITTSVQPIIEEGSLTLVERLRDPDGLVQLIKDFQYMPDILRAAEDNLSMPYKLPVNITDMYSETYSEFHTSMFRFLESLAPSSGVSASFTTTLHSTLNNVLQSRAKIIQVLDNSGCYVYEPTAIYYHWIELLERQVIGRREEHVDLLCTVPTSNLTQLAKTMWEDLGWKEVARMFVYGEWNSNTTAVCSSILVQATTLYDKVVDVMRHYESDVAARTRLTGCFRSAVIADPGQQIIGLMVATENFLKSLFLANFPVILAILRSVPSVARVLYTLGTRVKVLLPLQEVLQKDYDFKMNMSARVTEATRHLMLDVNRIYPGEVEKVAAVSETLKGMQKWMKVKEEGEGANQSLAWDPEEEETPLEVLFEFVQSRGAEVFASDLLDTVNYTHLLGKINKHLRLKAVLSLSWLDPITAHITKASNTIKTLSTSESIFQLQRMTIAENPLTFLSWSLEFIQLEEWQQLAESFQGLLQESVPLLTGSQLGDDLQSVVEGVNSILAARGMGVLDFKVPITSLVLNVTELEHYLITDLKMQPKVVEALRTSKLNMLALLTLRGSSVEEMVCKGQQMERLVVLPSGTQVTAEQVSSALCYTKDSTALVTSFMAHLNLTPLISMLTKFGVNTSLSSNDVSLHEVGKAIHNVAQVSEHMPDILTTLQAFHNLSQIMMPSSTPTAQRLVDTRTAPTIANITSSEFLKRAGQALCGRPLKLMHNKFGLQEAEGKHTPSPSTNNKDLGVCEQLHEDLRTLPGGGLLLHYIKPLLTGKIFYTPDNIITRAIIAQANETFEAVGRQRQNLKKMSEQAKTLTTTTDFDLQRLEKAMELPWVQGAMKDILHSIPTPSTSSFNVSSLPSFASLTANLKQASPHLIESSRLTTEFTDVLDVGINLMSCLELQRFIPVKSEDQLLEEAHLAVEKKEFLAGVVFKGVGETGSTETVLPDDITYAIRVDYSKSPPTFLLGPKFWSPGPYSDMAFYMRYHQGFLQLQDTLERAILKQYYRQAKAGGGVGAGRRRKRSTNSFVPLSEKEEDLLLNLPVHTKQQPYPCYTKDDFLQMVNESPVMSFIFSFLSLVLFTTFIIQQLVKERESRNKQLQEVMGLRLWLDHLVWLLCSLLLLLVIVLLSASLLSFGRLQPRADFGLLFAFLFCYGLSVVSFCYMVACVVPTTVLAVFTGVMMLLVFNIPFISISVIQSTVPLTVLVLSSLLPSTAFGFGFRIICQYELVDQGINYTNLWIPPTKGSDMTLGLAITMLLLDTVLFFVLTLISNYIRNDVPRHLISQGGSEGGTKRSSFMQQFSAKRSNDFTLNVFPEEAVHIVDLDLGLKQSLRKGLSITGLRKIYHLGGSGSRVAVDGLTLDLYEGQVLALLGHNGAGKTTVISMLTHEVKPTAGTIQVYGQDIGTSQGWQKARQTIGLCPQESVLFPLLTVEETLAYYTNLKQHRNDPPPTSVLKVLGNMNLLEHRYFMSHQLSEGLRRRLCLAVAFVGHSKLVVLDEPTSGIDPAARSVMWEVISNNRSGRTILLTTHHLDEAETLADRVAVMHKGRLLCVGSPLALKSEYGLGYSITLSKASPPPPLPPSDVKADTLQVINEKTVPSYTEELPFKVLKTSQEGFGASDVGGDKDKVWSLLTQYVPNARLLESVNGEVTYSLPIQDSLGNTNRLPELFGELEGNLEQLGYVSLELRPTSLEDVIIALNTLDTFESISNRSNIRVETPIASQKDLTTTYDFGLDHAGCCVGLRRLAALLHKRLLHHGRDWHFYVQIFVLPFVFILLALIASKLRPSLSKATPITLDPSLYPAPATTFLRTLDPTLGPLADEVTRLSLGMQDRTGNWSSCPSYVANTNPGLEQCSVAGSSVESACQCLDERCVVEATGHPSLNDWILATRSDHVQTRQGGITFGVKDPREGEEGRSGALVWYDNSAFHALPSYVNLLNNARLRRLAGHQHTITAINHPIVFSVHGMWSMSIQQHVADLGIGLLVLVALTVVCSATVGCAVAERVRGERRLLHLAGLSKTTYWFANALWDTAVVVVNIVLMSLLFLAFKEQQFIWRENLMAFITLALLYGLSILPLFYLLEGWFKTEASAVFFFFCSFFGVGLITTLLLVVCQVMPYIKEGEYARASTLFGMNDTLAVIKYLFLVFPPFTFTCSLKDMAASYTRASIMARFDMDLYTSPFTWDPELQGGLGVYMVGLGVWAVVGWVLLLCPRPTLDPDPRPTVGEEGQEDKDVVAERIKIQCGGTSLYDTVLRLVGLGCDFTKPPVTAVGNLFLALRRGECFSLLGLNGAGKTTTFRCLTGDLRPSRGQIVVNGLLLEEALDLPSPMLSYCPQTNALDPNLTPKEVLTNMARMRGAAGPRTKKVVDQAIKQLGLSGESNTYVRHLSGGNKRKLSVAVSLLGNPLLVLMDEPTTGMDPASRRLVWRAIQSVSQDGRSVLLTSHSMDEVNQLSHRMAIMVNGHFVCLGSPHYLKHKLGDKYTVRLKTRDIEDMTYVVDYLRSHLKEVLLKEQHHLSLVVEVNRQLSLQLIFDTLNGAKSLGVTEYDVSQTTLNEVFRVLTSHQGDGHDPMSVRRRTRRHDSTTSLLPSHYPHGTKPASKDTTFHHPSIMAPVDCIDPTAPYGNLGDVLFKRESKRGLLDSMSGSVNDSFEEEEWTQL